LVTLALPVWAAAPPTPDPARLEVLSFNVITGNEPILGKLAELADKPDHAKKLIAAAVDLTRETPLRMNRNTTFLMALAAESQKQADSAILLYKLYAQLSDKRGSLRGILTAYMGIIQANLDAGRNAEAEKVCREFLLEVKGDPDDPDFESIEQLKETVFRRMIIAVARQGGTDKALKILDRLIKGDEKNWFHYSLKAQVLREAERNEEAAKVYLMLVEKISKDDRLKKKTREDWADEFRYVLSGLYVDMNQVDKAAEQLKALLARDPDNPTYNNDLGFIWADHGKNLAEAEKLIRKAIDEDRKARKMLNPESKGDKDNASYLDSLGWVLYKRGKAKEAKPFLLEAVKEPEGQHLEILDHLGDVHLALGEKEEAIAAWKKGLTFSTKSKRDKKRMAEVEKKIKAAQEKK
jgi:tetratricopeptide (TPR) repeat protein